MKNYSKIVYLALSMGRYLSFDFSAPGASGNIVTEDLVFLLEIDFDRLIAARNVVATALPDVELYGFTPDAGLPLSSPLR